MPLPDSGNRTDGMTAEEDMEGTCNDSGTVPIDYPL